MKYILLFLFVFQTFAYSQGNKKAALLKSIESTTSPEKKSSLYLQLAKEYKKTNIDSLLFFADKGYQIAKKSGDEKGIGENADVLGDAYIAKNKFNKAYFYFTIAANYWKATNKLHEYCKTTMILGNINMVQNKSVKAFDMYREALKVAKKEKFTDLMADLNNNIGTVYGEIGNTTEAEKYFRESYNNFIKQGREVSAVFPLANVSNMQIEAGKNDEALKNYDHILDILLKHGTWEEIIFAYKSISKVYIDLKKYDLAEIYTNKALKIINENKASSIRYRGPISQEISIVYQNAALISQNKNQLDQAIEYAHKSLKAAKAFSDKKLIYTNAEVLAEIYEKQKRTDSALYYSKMVIDNYKEFGSDSDSKKVAQILLKFQFENTLRQREIDIVKNQAKTKRNELIFLSVSIFTVLGVIIMFLLFRNQKVQVAKLLLNKEKLELEKTSLNHDLEYKRKELASNMMNLASKNEFIASIAQKLKALKSENDTEYQKVIQQLIVELNKNSSGKIWEEFEIRFKEVHSAFYENLNRTHPDLTPNEIKICAFLRLNMSTKDISAITHQSVKSINMARFRLRKKLDIESDENLINFLIQL